MARTGDSPAKTTTGYDVYSKHEFLRSLPKRLTQAGDGSRVLITTMGFDPSQPEIASVMTALEAAAGRGAEVTMGVDGIAFMRHLDPSRLGPLWYGKELRASIPEPFRAKWTALQRLDSYPTASAQIINQPKRPFSVMIAGRSHIKIALIDDYIYLGSSNLENPDYIENAVGFQNKKAARELYELLMPAVRQGHIRRALEDRDRTIELDDRTSIFVDAGVRGQSEIFTQALELIDSAEKWLTITCQYFPNSVTAKHLLQAQNRGVDVKVLFSHPSHQGTIGAPLQHLNQFIERRRIPRNLFEDGLDADEPMVHAKVIACDKGVMTGSHNYVRAGVRLGTAEIALLRHDEALAHAVIDSVETALTAAAR